MKVALSSLGLIASVLLFGLMGVNWRSAIAQNTVIYSPSAPRAASILYPKNATVKSCRV
uniref:Uncharacterized protein n=1 Tax=Desertifilum tharense IPPAS B-1220 TaxID=1781255 RepID=A0ACD5GWB2_9CYAN